MTAKTKWIIYGALALIAVLLIAIFSKNIVNGLENLFVKIAIYLIVFCAGMASGPLRRKPPQERQRAQRPQHHPGTEIDRR